MEHKLNLAIFHNNINAVKDIVQEIGINCILERGDTALIRAAWMGNEEVVKYLIDQKANLNIQNEDGYTALIQATYSGLTNIVKMLIDAGADVNLQTKTGTNALILASIKDHTEIMKMLIQAGTNLQTKTNLGYTAMDYADSVPAFALLYKTINPKTKVDFDQIKTLNISMYSANNYVEQPETTDCNTMSQ